jgi:hypothetical protein
MWLGRERSSKRSLFKNNLRLLSHTLALNTPAHDWQEDDVASTAAAVAVAGAAAGAGAAEAEEPPPPNLMCLTLHTMKKGESWGNEKLREESHSFPSGVGKRHPNM